MTAKRRRCSNRPFEGKPEAPPAVAALLALTYLLRGERVEADDVSVRRAPADAGRRARDG